MKKSAYSLVMLLSAAMFGCNSSDDTQAPSNSIFSITDLNIVGDWEANGSLSAVVSCSSCDEASFDYQWRFNDELASDQKHVELGDADTETVIRLEVVAELPSGERDSAFLVADINKVEATFPHQEVDNLYLWETHYSYGQYAVDSEGAAVVWGRHADTSQVESELQSGVVDIVSNWDGAAALKSDGTVVSWGEELEFFAANVQDIFTNRYAFAALLNDGSVKTWGEQVFGGDSDLVSDHLASGVIDVIPLGNSFAALKEDGSLITWGEYGQETSDIPDGLKSGVIDIVSNGNRYVVLKSDGSVVSMGDDYYFSDVSHELMSGVTQVFPGYSIGYVYGQSYAAIKDDGSLVVWGSGTNHRCHINHSGVETGVVDVLGENRWGYFLSKEDGSVEYCGALQYKWNAEAAEKFRSNVDLVRVTRFNIYGIKSDGSLVYWHEPTGLSAVESELHDLVDIQFTRSEGVALLRADGAVFTFGTPVHGGDSSHVAHRIQTGVNQLVALPNDFVAVKDNEFVVWGGGYPLDESLQNNIMKHLTTNIFANSVITRDGQVISWGTSFHGGDNSLVAEQLKPRVRVVDSSFK